MEGQRCKCGAFDALNPDHQVQFASGQHGANHCVPLTFGERMQFQPGGAFNPEPVRPKQTLMDTPDNPHNLPGARCQCGELWLFTSTPAIRDGKRHTTEACGKPDILDRLTEQQQRLAMRGSGLAVELDELIVTIKDAIIELRSGR